MNKSDRLEIFYLFSDRTYKAWYYGMYLQTNRSIIVDSCTVIDGNVGILGIIFGPNRTFYF